MSIIGIFETNLSLSLVFEKYLYFQMQHFGGQQKIINFPPGIFHVIILYHMGGEERIMIITECLFVECMACLIP